MEPTTTKETRRGLPSLTRGANWRDEAACRHADPDLFFPVGTTGLALRQVDEAKRICRACPARTPCLAWALGNAIPAGIWAGTTEEERRAIRSTRIGRERRRAAQATTADRGPCDRGALTAVTPGSDMSE